VANDTKGADAITGVTWNVTDVQKAAIEQYGTLTLNANGTWEFTLDNSAGRPGTERQRQAELHAELHRGRCRRRPLQRQPQLQHPGPDRRSSGHHA
jgi:hypothetical protein